MNVNRIVLITGAAGALGRATANAFRRAGARLALLDINEQGLRSAYSAEDANQKFVVADLKDSKSLTAAGSAAVQQFGRLDVVCNIAGGFTMGHTVHETPDEVWRRMLDLNAGSVLNVTRAMVPHMLKAGGGAIVNVAAMAALRGSANMAAYSASKSAVVRLTESMAVELAPKGIRVNCVLPSTMDTPVNRADMPDVDPSTWVDPAAVADVIAFLASDAARGVQGAAIPVEANTRS